MLKDIILMGAYGLVAWGMVIAIAYLTSYLKLKYDKTKLERGEIREKSKLLSELITQTQATKGNFDKIIGELERIGDSKKIVH